MPRIAPLAEADADDQVGKTYGRLKELIGASELPAMFLPMGRVEAFLRDFFMNFKKFVWTGGHIDEPAKAAVALAVAAHAKSEAWTDFYAGRVKSLGGDDQRVADILAVASTNYMYNTFFKFRDLSGSSLFDGMGVGLRAHTFANTSLDEKTVELINIADANEFDPGTFAFTGQVVDQDFLSLPDHGPGHSVLDDRSNHMQSRREIVDAVRPALANWKF